MKDKKVFISASNFCAKSAFIGVYDATKALPIKDSKEISCIYKAKIEELDRSVSAIESAIVEIDEKISGLNEIESTIDEVQNSISILNDSIDSVLSSTEDTISAISELKDKAAIVDFKLSGFYQNFVQQNDDASLRNLYVEGEAGKLKEEYVEQISYLYGKKYTYNDEVQFDFSNAIELRYFGINNRDLIGIDDYNFTINLSSSDDTYSVLDNTITLDDEEELESSVLKYLIESETISSLYVNRDDLSKISVCFVSEEMDTFDLAIEEDESGTVSSVNEFVTADLFNETSVKVDTSLSTIKEKIENVDFLSNSISQPSLDEISRRCDLFLDILKSL